MSKIFYFAQCRKRQGGVDDFRVALVVHKKVVNTNAFMQRPIHHFFHRHEKFNENKPEKRKNEKKTKNLE